MNQDRKNEGRQNTNRRFNSQGRSNQGRSNFRRNSSLFENREMHKAKCDECKKDCEVPFKPTEGKPVFCRECYAKRKRF